MIAGEDSHFDFSTHDLSTSDDALPSHQTAAIELYDRGMTTADYWREASEQGTFDPDVAAELAGGAVRDGEVVYSEGDILHCLHFECFCLTTWPGLCITIAGAKSPSFSDVLPWVSVLDT